MKIPKVTLAFVAFVASAAFAGLAIQQHPATSKETQPTSINPIRLEQMAVRNAGFNVGPTSHELHKSPEEIIEGLYSCPSSILSPAFNARFYFDPANETVTIENLGGFCANEDYQFEPAIIEAPFVDGVITIPCENVGPDQENSTYLGVLAAYGMDVYLQVGVIEWDDNFMSCVPDPIPELKLYVSEDYSTIETSLEEGMSVTGVIDYMDFYGIWACSGACKGGLNFTRISQGSGWTVSDESLDFGNTFVGSTTTRTFTMKSTGDTDVEFSVSVDSPAFTVTPSEGTLQASSKQSFQVAYSPTSPGEDTATLTISGGGREETITLTAIADIPETDFSAIVTSGNPSIITWENSSNYPWRLIDGKAVNDLKTANDETTLKAAFSGSRPKRITYDINLRRNFKDQFIMAIEGREMFDYQSLLSHTVSFIVPGGNRSVEWTLKSGYYPEGAVSIGNLRIEEVASWEGLSPDASVTPLTAEGFMNINGYAVPSGASSVMMLSLNPKQESNLSFDYSAGSSEISVSVNEVEIEKIAAGENGTYHYDMAQGSPSFVTIKATTPSDKLSEAASIGNVRFVAGKFNDTPAKYHALLNSYFNEDDSYTLTDGTTYSYPLDITLSTGGKAVFKYLLPSNPIYPDQQVITGELIGNKIHIPTYKNINLGTLVGYDNESLENYPIYYNNRYWLVAGKIDKDKKQTEVLDELTLTISEDGRIITADSDFGVYTTWSAENGDIVSFFHAGSQFVLASDAQEITTTTESIDFGTTIANDYPYQRSFTILSAGRECEYSAVVEGGNGHFSISPEAGTLKAGETVEITVTLKSAEEGEFDGVVTVYSDGNDLTIPVAAIVTPLPDYSVIVTEGKDLISFDAKTEYPWAVEDGVAVSTNAGIHNSMSILTAAFNVPEGKVGMLGIEGATCAEPSYDGFAIVVDGKTIYSDAAHNEHISFIYPFTAGEYRVEFIHVRDVMDELWTPYDQSRITALSLTMQSPGAAHVRQTAPFSMEAAVGDVASDVVCITNTSDSSVEILSVRADEPFGAIMPQTTLLPGKNSTVEIPVTFLSETAGEFAGSIIVETTAGIVEIPVSASADYVKYIGEAETTGYGIPYGAESLGYGDVGLTTTMLYPAEAMAGLQNASIESVTFFTSDIPDYTFSCPDMLVEAGDTDVNTINGPVEGLETVMTGEMVDAYNWELTIPFDEPFVYEGGNFILQLTNNAVETYAGNMPIKMAFLLSSSINGSTVVSFKGYLEQSLKTVPFIKVRYTANSDGIEKVTRPLSEIKEVRYYSTDGVQLQAPVKGLNVIVTVYEDGATSSSIMMKR